MFEQLANLYRGLSTARRASLWCVALALGGGLTWLATSRPQAEYVSVLGGRTFSGRELAAARERLAAAQLQDYQVAGRQILAPAEDAARFEAALAADSAAAGWAGAWQEANDSLSPFASGRQQHDAREIARARLISEMLKQLPDVEHAELVWDEEPRIGWRQPPRVRATVYLQPREQREITLDTIDAVQRAVAGSKAHLDPADVVVLDLRRMVAYGRRTEGIEGVVAEQRLAAQTAACRRRIEDALSDIAGVHVAVIVEPVETANGGGHLPASARTAPINHTTPPAPALAASRGGPNQRLAVDPAPHAAHGNTSEPLADTRRTTARAETGPMGASAPQSVRAIVSLPRNYVRERAIEGDTAAVFARRTPAEQEALLADVKRAIVEEVTARTARIARVEVRTQETPVAAVTTEATPATGQVPSALAALARWDRTTQWAVGGLAAYIVIWQLVRLIGRRRQPPRGSVLAAGSHSERSLASAAPSDALRPHADHENEASGRRAEQLLERLNAADPAEWRLELAGVDPEVIGELLQSLAPDRVAALMAALSQDVQQQALSHLAGLGPLGAPPAPLVQTVRRVKLPAVSPPGEYGDLEELDDADPAVLRRLYAQLPGEVWSTALMGASAAFRVRLLSALPAGEAAALRQSLTRQRPARLRDIETAQQQVLELLHGSGALVAAR